MIPLYTMRSDLNNGVIVCVVVIVVDVLLCWLYVSDGALIWLGGCRWGESS